MIYDGIGDNITYHNASSIIENLYDSKLITSREMDIMKMAVNDRTLQNSENKNTVRADILKNMLITVLS